jgi:hypothetical protein
MSKLDGRCPACNRKLSATPKTIELKPEYDLRSSRIKK